MKSYTYLFIDISTILVPLVFSLHPKLRFDKQWPNFIPSLLIVGAVFLIWDEYFTRIGVWGFNPDYLIGVSVFNLPLEEVLFFVCIPYACVFTYHCFNKLDINPMPKNSGKWITIILVLGSAVVLVFNFGKFYTTSTFLLLVLSLIYLQWVRKVNLTSFYFSYLVLLLPFALTNGILTGSFIESEVVWYNDLENIGLRIGTIPVEDIFYGMLLILWNIRLMEYFYQRNQSSNSVAG